MQKNLSLVSSKGESGDGMHFMWIPPCEGFIVNPEINIQESFDTPEPVHMLFGTKIAYGDNKTFNREFLWSTVAGDTTALQTGRNNRKDEVFCDLWLYLFRTEANDVPQTNFYVPPNRVWPVSPEKPLVVWHEGLGGNSTPYWFLRASFVPKYGSNYARFLSQDDPGNNTDFQYRMPVDYDLANAVVEIDITMEEVLTAANPEKMDLLNLNVYLVPQTDNLFPNYIGAMTDGSSVYKGQLDSWHVPDDENLFTNPYLVYSKTIGTKMALGNKIKVPLGSVKANQNVIISIDDKSAEDSNYVIFTAIRGVISKRYYCVEDSYIEGSAAINLNENPVIDVFSIGG